MSLPNILNMAHSVGGGSTLTLTHPQQPWDLLDQPVGGGESSAAGVPSNYTILHMPIITLHLRITEGSEWSNYVTFLRTVDDAAAAMTVKLDKNVSTTIVGYIKSPSVANNEPITFQRDGGDPSVLLTTLTLRQTSNTILAPTYVS